MKILDLERFLKALANERRIKILRYLESGKEASVGNIAEHIKLSFQSTSKHLGVLTMAGVVEKEQRSLEVFYRIADPKHTLVRYVTSIL